MLNSGYILDGKYEVVRVLGQGGMSTVYLCRNNRLGNLWAVKEVKGEIKDNMDFLAEPNILKNLSHPGIPRIVDIFYEGDDIYIVEDYIEGETLEDFVKREGRLYTQKVYDITLKLCDIIEYLHSMDPPIIYRDLKPSNIMVTLNGGIVLIDFGISRTYKSGQEKDTIFMGSRGYAAPEQYGNSQSNKETDIYGLGATMYFMALGKDPPSFMEISNDENFEEVDMKLKNIIKKAMQYKTYNRYQDIACMRHEILSIPGRESGTIVLEDRGAFAKTIVLESTKTRRMDSKPEVFNLKKPWWKVYKIAALVVIFTLMLLWTQQFLWGSDRKSSDVSNSESKPLNIGEAKAPAPTPAVKPEGPTPAPVKDLFVHGIIDTESPVLIDNSDTGEPSGKGKTKGKRKVKDEGKVYDVLYKVNPAAAAGRFENKFVMQIEYVEQKGDYSIAYCTIENNTGKQFEISYKSTYLLGDEDEPVKAYVPEDMEKINIPSGVGEKEIQFAFKDFDMDTKEVTLKTMVTPEDTNYSKEISLSADVK